MRAPWIEPDEVYDGGPGAHAENPRYDHVDDPEGKYDAVESKVLPPPRMRLALALATTDTSPGRRDMGDGSHYQFDKGAVDLSKVKATGVRGWAQKVSQSINFIDPTWTRACTQMLLADFEWMAGYHWVSSTTDPEKQASWFLQCLGEAAAVMALMADAEETPLSVDNLLGFYQEVERLRAKQFGIQAPCTEYTGAFVTKGTIFSDPRLRESKYGIRPVILAAYTTRAKMLDLPNVQKMGIQGWQYSSSGSFSGIVGNVDVDEIQDMGAFQVSMHGTYTPPEPPPIEDVDMVAIVTNEDAYTDDAGIAHAALETKWEYLGGERIHIPFEYWNGLGAPAGNPRPYAEIMLVPEHVAPSAPQNGGAPTSFAGSGTVTVELHAS